MSLQWKTGGKTQELQEAVSIVIKNGRYGLDMIDTAVVYCGLFFNILFNALTLLVLGDDEGHSACKEVLHQQSPKVWKTYVEPDQTWSNLWKRLLRQKSEVVVVIALMFFLDDCHLWSASCL